MLFHVDMIYIAKQAKRDVEKKLCFEIRTVTKSFTFTRFRGSSADAHPCTGEYGVTGFVR